jgi:hypothetical protein
LGAALQVVIARIAWISVATKSNKSTLIFSETPEAVSLSKSFIRSSLVEKVSMTPTRILGVFEGLSDHKSRDFQQQEANIRK